MGATTRTCIGFDSAALAGTYSPPTLDLGDDVKVTINTAPWVATTYGFATYGKVGPVAFDGWTGNALSLSNVYLVFNFGFGRSLEYVSFRYHDASGRHFLEINDVPHEFTRFPDLPSFPFGPVNPNVVPNPDESREGTVELRGPIDNTLVIGSGEMLWIDDLCYEFKPR